MKTSTFRTVAMVAATLLILSGCGGFLGGLFGGDGDDRESQDPLRVAVLMDGSKDDRSFSQMAFEGAQDAAAEFGGYVTAELSDVRADEDLQIAYTDNASGSWESAVRDAAVAGIDLILGIGFGFTEAIDTVASEYPETHFALVDGSLDGLSADDNITVVTFDEHEGSFLAGAVAGFLLADDSGPGSTVGFIGGMDIDLIHKFQGGYMAGAMWVNPDLRADGTILTEYIGTTGDAFNDPAVAKSIADGMYGNGAAVIYHAAGASGAGLFESAEAEGKWAIGVDSDQGAIYADSSDATDQAEAEHIATSMLKRIDRAVFLMTEDLVTGEGTLAGGYVSYGLAEGGVGLARNDDNSALLQPYETQLQEITDDIISGEIQVPDHDNQLGDWKTENGF